MKHNILIAVRWPVGGIRTYIRYIYTHDWFQRQSIQLLTPSLELKPYFDNIFSNSDFCYTESEKSTFGLVQSAWAIIRNNKPQLLHSHGLTAALLMAPLAKLYGVPHVATTHDVFLERHFSGVKGRCKRWLIGQLLRLVDVINPCGFDTADNLAKTYPHLKAKIRPIQNGIDSQAFLNNSVRNLRQELNLADDVLLLGYFGRFMEQKGFDLLVSALQVWLKNQPNKKVHVACFGWGGFIREEQEKLQQLNLDSCFSFMPQTDDMPAALRGVDVAVMPSRWEACPLLPMESMVAGAVVLASDCIGMKEVCANSPAQIFESENIEALYIKLVDVESNLPLLKVQAQEFSAQAAQQFDCRQTAEKLQQLYQAVLTP